MYLGIKVVIAKSFARIHKANLINFGIIPLEFLDLADYQKISSDDILYFKDVIKSLNENKEILVENLSKNFVFKTKYNLTEREREIIKEGGYLPYIKKSLKSGG
jgi:aconitate hydratase